MNQPAVVQSSILGFVVPGGPVRTDFLQTDPNKLTLTLTAPGDLPTPLSSVSDVVCFLLPNAPVPPTHGILIYWQVLSAEIQTGFELLGALTPQRSSGIFRTNWPEHDQVAPLLSPCQVVLGVSMERLEEVQNITSQQQPWDARLFAAQKIATDLFNYMQSFDSGTGGQGQLVVPNNIFDRWLKRFEARFRRDPNFFMKKQD